MVHLQFPTIDISRKLSTSVQIEESTRYTFKLFGKDKTNVHNLCIYNFELKKQNTHLSQPAEAKMDRFWTAGSPFRVYGVSAPHQDDKASRALSKIDTEFTSLRKCLDVYYEAYTGLVTAKCDYMKLLAQYPIRKKEYDLKLSLLPEIKSRMTIGPNGYTVKWKEGHSSDSGDHDNLLWKHRSLITEVPKDPLDSIINAAQVIKNQEDLVQEMTQNVEICYHAISQVKRRMGRDGLLPPDDIPEISIPEMLSIGFLTFDNPHAVTPRQFNFSDMDSMASGSAMATPATTATMPRSEIINVEEMTL